mmetsp:Transcript_18706/g.57527  ORF Transcript_18706/g.57527 Transcript_18706/m.57527 type:complete len:449 (+) Transcript_18706:407-1753(+)
MGTLLKNKKEKRSHLACFLEAGDDEVPEGRRGAEAVDLDGEGGGLGGLVDEALEQVERGGVFGVEEELELVRELAGGHGLDELGRERGVDGFGGGGERRERHVERFLRRHLCPLGLKRARIHRAGDESWSHRHRRPFSEQIEGVHRVRRCDGCDGCSAEGVGSSSSRAVFGTEQTRFRKQPGVGRHFSSDEGVSHAVSHRGGAYGLGVVVVVVHDRRRRAAFEAELAALLLGEDVLVLGPLAGRDELVGGLGVDDGQGVEVVEEAVEQDQSLLGERADDRGAGVASIEDLLGHLDVAAQEAEVKERAVSDVGVGRVFEGGVQQTTQHGLHFGRPLEEESRGGGQESEFHVAGVFRGEIVDERLEHVRGVQDLVAPRAHDPHRRRAALRRRLVQFSQVARQRRQHVLAALRVAPQHVLRDEQGLGLDVPGALHLEEFDQQTARRRGLRA